MIVGGVVFDGSSGTQLMAAIAAMFTAILVPIGLVLILSGATKRGSNGRPYLGVALIAPFVISLIVYLQAGADTNAEQQQRSAKADVERNAFFDAVDFTPLRPPGAGGWAFTFEPSARPPMVLVGVPLNGGGQLAVNEGAVTFTVLSKALYGIAPTCDPLGPIGSSAVPDLPACPTVGSLIDGTPIVAMPSPAADTRSLFTQRNGTLIATSVLLGQSVADVAAAIDALETADLRGEWCGTVARCS